MACQKQSEFKSEVTWYERKYQMNFFEFDREFRSGTGTSELENDWMGWKFSQESYEYWVNLLEEMRE